jgi:hypothetical protein
MGDDAYLCECEKHGVCNSVCPGNCTSTSFDSTMTETCLQECLAFGVDLSPCIQACNTCVVQGDCWVDDGVFYDPTDTTCNTTCLQYCEKPNNSGGMWSSNDYMCSCDSHNVCMIACPENCNPDDFDTELASECLTTCVNKGTKKRSECATYCGKCVENLGCWKDTILKSDDDASCETECYGTECDAYLGSSTKFCDCSHNACVSTCEGNCDLYEVCYGDCNDNLDDAISCNFLCNHCTR